MEAFLRDIGAIIAMIVAIPLGLMSAIFLTQYASSGVRKVLKPLLEILAGVPTVVYGYFALLMVTPFAALILDVLSWWLTKWSPDFAWLTMISGVLYGLAGTVMIVTSLLQMWLPRWRRGG